MSGHRLTGNCRLRRWSGRGTITKTAFCCTGKNCKTQKFNFLQIHQKNHTPRIYNVNTSRTVGKLQIDKEEEQLFLHQLPQSSWQRLRCSDSYRQHLPIREPSFLVPVSWRHNPFHLETLNLICLYYFPLRRFVPLTSRARDPFCLTRHRPIHNCSKLLGGTKIPCVM